MFEFSFSSFIYLFFCNEQLLFLPEKEACCSFGKKKNTFKTIFVDSMIWWQRFKEPFGITGVDDIYGHRYLLSGSSIKTLADTRASGTFLWWREGRVRTVFWQSWFCCAKIWVQGRGGGRARSPEKQVSSRREDEKAAPGEELWNEMPQEGNFGEIVPWKGGVTIFFGCPGKHL